MIGWRRVTALRSCATVRDDATALKTEARRSEPDGPGHDRSGRQARDAEAGFTLIEALVAMAVLAVGAVALLGATERHTAQTRGLADRIAARWVAENEIAARQVGVAMRPEWRIVDGQEMVNRVESAAIPDSGLIEMRVATGPGGQTLVTLVGYLPEREDR